MKIKDKLKYIDERDKGYGLAGMAISMVALDGEEYLESMSLDAPAGECVEFSHDFYFVGNPNLSAKAAWNENLKHFQISSSMMISNIVCRNYVQHRHKISSDVVDQLRKVVREEARENCSLEDDETDEIFDKSFSYFDRLFSYARVHEIANNFVDAIIKQRRMSSSEIIEQLRQLSMI